MSLWQLDLPQLHKRTPEGIDFINALVSCSDLEFFNLKSVQILVDGHGSYWRRLNWLMIGLPFIG